MKKAFSNIGFYLAVAILGFSIFIGYRSGKDLSSQLTDAVVEIELESPLPPLTYVDERAQVLRLAHDRPLQVDVFLRWEQISPSSPLLEHWQSLAAKCSQKGIPIIGLVVPGPIGTEESMPPFPCFETANIEQFYRAGIQGVPLIALVREGGEVLHFWIGKPNLEKLDQIGARLDEFVEQEDSRRTAEH